jgi:hypothetical protein
MKYFKLPQIRDLIPLLRAVNLRGLALIIVLAGTITSIDHFIELLITLKKSVAVLPCMCLNSVWPVVLRP